MDEQVIINDFFRDYVDQSFKYVQNSVKLNPQHTEKHRRTMFEVCNVLVKHNIPFWTEVHLQMRCIPDIIAPTHITPIIEIMSTETLDKFEKTKFPMYNAMGFNRHHLKFIDANNEFNELDLF